MPLQTAVQGRAGQVRQGRLQRLETVIERQPCVAAESHDQGFFLPRQDRRLARLRPHGGITPVDALLPLRDRLRVPIVALGQLG
jgi:hypothetical protein